MASERTELRKLAAALDRLARLSHDSYSQVGPKPQAYIYLMAAAKFIRDHAAQPAPSLLRPAVSVQAEPSDRDSLRGRLQEQLGRSNHALALQQHEGLFRALSGLLIVARDIATWMDDPGSQPTAKDPIPATTPGTFSEAEVRDVVEHVRSGERACGYYGPSTSGLKDIIRDALDEVRRRRQHQLMPSPDHPVEEPKPCD